MGMTMVEKILAAHAGLDEVRPGEIVTCEADWVVHVDLMFTVGTPMPKRVHRPDRQIVVMDHSIPACAVKDADTGVKIRDMVARLEIPHFFDVGNHGISHQILAEHGYALPGMLLVCCDSHTGASGAFNCAARALGTLDSVAVACKGKTWFQVSPTIRYDLEGKLQERVNTKDVFLYIAGEYGDATNHSIEFSGSGIANLSIGERQTLATMCTEIGADFPIFPCDDRLIEYLDGRARETFTPVESDPDAEYEDIRRIDLGEVVPYVALLHSVPKNCAPVSEIGKQKIHQAFVGSCANGRLEDIAAAAEIVKGKKVVPGVRLIVTPASQRVYMDALRAGYFETLVESGAVVTNSTCGPCYGGSMGIVGAGERCVTSSPRNFKGRMGSSDSEIFLASPATVVASALTGYITDPRDIETR